MIRKIFLFGCFAALLVIYSFRPENKYFEGSITYGISVSGKNNIFNEKMKKELGDKTVFWYKDGDYRQEANGSLKSLEFYDHIKYLYYTRLTGSDTFKVKDMTLKTDSVMSFEVKKNVKKIKGYHCDEVVARLHNVGNFEMAVIMFYNKDICSINPEWFRLAKTNAMDVLYGEMKSIPLEINVVSVLGTITMRAQEISRSKLDASVVHIPEGAILKKMYE